jgi:3',5'-cyclic AMP phosphodiesterase CpdA
MSAHDENENENVKCKFAYVADMQPGSPKSFRYRGAWWDNWQTARQQIIDAEPEFMVIGGDITRDGFYNDFEFEEMKESLDSMNIPYHAIPGNMDVGNKVTHVDGVVGEWDDRLLNLSTDRLRKFERFFGDTTWSFTHKNIRFTGFCDMLLGSRYPEEKKLREFLADLADLPPAEHHFALTHYAIFIDSPDEEDFDITNKDEYTDWYFNINKADRRFLLKCFKNAGVTRILTGHIHCRREVRHDGMLFDYAPSTTFGQYADKWPDGDHTPGFYVFEVDGANVSKKFIPTNPLSENPETFGQGGHVTNPSINKK